MTTLTVPLVPPNARLILEDRPALRLQRADDFAEGVPLTDRLRITQRGEQERKEALNFEDPESGDDEQKYVFEFTEDVRYRTVDLNGELPGLEDEEWTRLNSFLSDTPMRIVQDMQAELKASEEVRSLSRNRSNPKEIQAAIDRYLERCLWSDGGNPSASTNTPMVTE